MPLTALLRCRDTRVFFSRFDFVKFFYFRRKSGTKKKKRKGKKISSRVLNFQREGKIN